MDVDEYIGCISCMETANLCDLFAENGENINSYAKILDNCFNLKVNEDLKYICSVCIEKLQAAVVFKEQTLKNMSMLLSMKEEHLDESILEEEETMQSNKDINEDRLSNILSDCDSNEMSEREDKVNILDSKGCHGCNKSSQVDATSKQVCKAHNAEDAGNTIQTCNVCKEVLGSGNGVRGARHAAARARARDYPCHFCDNCYSSRKACYTHLRMKHGLKLTNEQTPKLVKRQRKNCHICGRDFSQKQILNRHLWKEHGYEVEKRKALDCPLCEERVSYGAYFSDHLLAEHDVEEEIEELLFSTMDDFMIYKSSIQEETKFRYRKTTATKQTIEGLRSHYMCSQSGVYVYQGKGIRPAPERQIYKTGKACPAHMVVTEAVDSVKVTFHKTHVGHGACPYYEPREPKRRGEGEAAGAAGDSRLAWICDTCGMVFFEAFKFRLHVRTHNILEDYE